MSRLTLLASVIVRFPLTSAVAERDPGIHRGGCKVAAGVRVEQECAGEGRGAALAISHPVGAERVTVSLLPSPLPLTVKLVEIPAEPSAVSGRGSEVVLRLSTGGAGMFTANVPAVVVAMQFPLVSATWPACTTRLYVPLSVASHVPPGAVTLVRRSTRRPVAAVVHAQKRRQLAVAVWSRYPDVVAVERETLTATLSA